MSVRGKPVDHIAHLVQQRQTATDDEILAELTALPILPDESDPIWEDERTWSELADRFTALADIAAQRRLEAAIPLLLERASYGDPGEMMRGLRHSLEAIVAPQWHRLAEICMALAAVPFPGARYWALHELGILRDARTLQVLIASLDDDMEDIRAVACQGIEMLCQKDVASRPLAIRALERYLLQYQASTDQDAGREAIEAIRDMMP